MDKIAAGLERDGILTGAGKEKWHTSTINKILRNEKYMGDALLQKTVTTDFLTKKRIKNNGTAPQYYVENNHEAIIPKELFMLVQEELVRRRAVKVDSFGKRHTYSCNHVFSQIVYCGCCGNLFRRIHWNNRGCKSIVWRCVSRLEPSSATEACRARTVNEQVLQSVIVKAINKILSNQQNYLNILQENIATVIKTSNAASEEAIDQRLMELQKEIISKANNKEAYDTIADEIFLLRELKHESEIEGVTRDEHIKRISELHDFITQNPHTELTEFDETLVRRLLQKVTVYDDYYTVEFKSGVSVDV